MFIINLFNKYCLRVRIIVGIGNFVLIRIAWEFFFGVYVLGGGLVSNIGVYVGGW